MRGNHLAIVEVAKDGVGLLGGEEVAGDNSLRRPQIVDTHRHEGAVAFIVNGGSQLPRGALNGHTAHLSLACTRTQRTYHTNNQPITPHNPRVQKMGQLMRSNYLKI